jgi:hypothetical protein
MEDQPLPAENNNMTQEGFNFVIQFLSEEFNKITKSNKSLSQYRWGKKNKETQTLVGRKPQILH